MRVFTTIAVGATIASLGIIIFLYAHIFSSGVKLQAFNETHRNLHEMLWAAFGISIWLGGIIIAAVGMAAWCNNRRD